MNSPRIIIFGSTYLSQVVYKTLLEHKYEIVGHVPNINEVTVPGEMDLPIVTKEKTPHDLILSVQFDSKIKSDCAYNVHTGLLPDWGGQDLLYHTIKEKAKVQGLTFHKITNELDEGPIISSTTYPVFPSDKIVDLYERLVTVCPLFVLNCLKLLEIIDQKEIEAYPSLKPRMYYRGEILRRDLAEYKETKNLLRGKYL